MADGEGFEPTILSELIYLGLALWTLDKATDGWVRRFASRMGNHVMAYVTMILDAAHGGRETIGMAEEIKGARR